MPESFGDPAAEARACLSAAALFDYSFLVRLRAAAPGAAEALSRACGRDLSAMAVGAIRYALATDADGYLRSDLTVWRTGPESFELMSGRGEDAGDCARLPGLGGSCADLSDDTAVLAVQGPASLSLLRQACDDPAFAAPARFRFADASILGAPCRVARLGFTGLEGVEIVCPAEAAQSLWDGLAERGGRPAGFQAADRLRLAAGLALFSKEFAPPVSAADAGLARFRPAGGKSQDRRPARVRRVSAVARVEAVADPSPDGLAALAYRRGDPFPPEPGTIVVTSANVAPAGNTVLAMGYLAAGAPDAAYPDCHGTSWTVGA
jgi:aminomethyltransferase